MAAEFDINAHLNSMRFGQGSGGDGGGGGAAGEAITPDELLRKGVDKAVNTVTKVLTGILGIHTNSDIEGKGATSPFELQNMGSGFSLTNMAMFRSESGGGFLSMLLDMVKRHLTRELPSAVADGGGAGGSASGGGGGGGDYDSGGGGGSGAAMAGGGGDMPSSMPSFGGGGDVADVQVNYGGKMVSAEVMMSQVGNFSPPETPIASSGTRGTGTDVGM